MAPIKKKQPASSPSKAKRRTKLRDLTPKRTAKGGTTVSSSSPMTTTSSVTTIPLSQPLDPDRMGLL